MVVYLCTLAQKYMLFRLPNFFSMIFNDGPVCRSVGLLVKKPRDESRSRFLPLHTGLTLKVPFYMMIWDDIIRVPYIFFCRSGREKLICKTTPASCFYKIIVIIIIIFADMLCAKTMLADDDEQLRLCCCRSSINKWRRSHTLHRPVFDEIKKEGTKRHS